MSLFSIFKKKPEAEALIVPTDGIKALGDGVLFEDENVFLKWGADPEINKLYIKKEFRADKVIYQWGERTILRGLKLHLKTICWYHKQHGDTRSFESVEFLAEGDEAKGKFDAIRSHIEGIIGESKDVEDMEPGEVSLEWKVKAIKVSLNFFNRDQPKTRLEIGWWL